MISKIQKQLFSVLSIGLLIALSLSTNSCKKKGNLFSDGNLEFSVDTLVFDTIFTTIGSTTQQFKIYNEANQQLEIEEVELMGGTSSPFRINLDGLIGTDFQNIIIPGNDSLFCFVEVTLGINGQNLPMVIEDSIRFRSNGVDQYVRLAVWGQDMYYHFSNTQAGIFDTNSGVWPNDKPHLIYGAAFVDSAETLTIPAGTNIYLHKNSILWNYKGTLNIDGDVNNKVTLQGDRLESFYDDVSGQYYGIYFQEALPSTIDNVVIKNATTGIHVDSRNTSTSSNTVTITNTEISNSASYGILLYNEPKIFGENVLVHSSGIHSLIVLQGADFVFNHCDFLGYGDGEGTSPSVGLRNYFTNSSGTTTVTDLTGQFNNCVIWGSTDEDQYVLDKIEAGGVTISVLFRNSVIRKSDISGSEFTSCLNTNPLFLNTSEKNFSFSSSTSSSLKNNGSSSYTTLIFDLVNEVRQAVPDIGCYEKL
ncbi:MAG: right-handed parallel beta-helix repeat-containing protein [Fluviicola sp.]